MKNQIEEIVYHKDQMSLDFNWEEIDDELIQREATISVENGEYDNCLLYTSPSPRDS